MVAKWSRVQRLAELSDNGIFLKNNNLLKNPEITKINKKIYEYNYKNSVVALVAVAPPIHGHAPAELDPTAAAFGASTPRTRLDLKCD